PCQPPPLHAALPISLAPQLRSDAGDRRKWNRGPSGRSRHRAADPQLLPLPRLKPEPTRRQSWETREEAIDPSRSPRPGASSSTLLRSHPIATATRRGVVAITVALRLCRASTPSSPKKSPG